MTGNAKITDSLESSLKVMSERVDHLRTCISEKESEKAKLQRELETIYETPLSDGQVIEFVTELIDYRAGYYEAQLRSVGMLEAMKFPRERAKLEVVSNPSPLVLGDVEQALGNRRLDEKKSGNPLEQFKIEIFRDYGVFQWWPYFFFGEAMKEKFSAIMREDGSGAGRETLEDRRIRAKNLHEKITRLSGEINGLRAELEDVIKPLEAAMIGFGLTGVVR